MKASELKNAEMLLASVFSKSEIEIDSETLRQAKWVNVKEELPTEEGLYFVLTDEGWCMGIATYFKNTDTGQFEFNVWLAVSGTEPKVEFWLKDNSWGLIYEEKKKKGDI